jgi:allantoicase
MRTDLLVDLAGAAVGGQVLQVSDEYLNPAARLIAAGPPAAPEGESGDRGPRRDGWETRRQIGGGHDWAIVRLGLPGFVRLAVLDTSYFEGDVPAEWSLEAIELHGDPGIVDLVRSRDKWTEFVARSPVGSASPMSAVVASEMAATHVRLVIYPDGGVARLRCLGDPIGPIDLADRGEIDLASLSSGARVVDVSDAGPWSPNTMLGQPGGSGWHTRRRRRPGREWAVVRLGGRGRVTRIRLDTRRFQGHAPRVVHVEAIDAPGAHPDDLRLAEWIQLLGAAEPEPGKRTDFDEFPDPGPVTHLRLGLAPDGAIARFHAFGEAEGPWQMVG